jgi:hypothetical protein
MPPLPGDSLNARPSDMYPMSAPSSTENSSTELTSTSDGASISLPKLS